MWSNNEGFLDTKAACMEGSPANVREEKNFTAITFMSFTECHLLILLIGGQNTFRLTTPCLIFILYCKWDVLLSILIHSFFLLTLCLLNFLIIGSLFGLISYVFLVSKMTPFIFSCFFSNCPYVGFFFFKI